MILRAGRYEYEAFLMSLQPLPVEQQGVLHTTVDVAPATLDEWATERDKAPREALAVQVKPDLAPPWATISLTKADFDAFERMARGHVRFRADPSEIVDRRLMAANLFDEVGKATEIGSWIRRSCCVGIPGRLRKRCNTRHLSASGPWEILASL